MTRDGISNETDAQTRERRSGLTTRAREGHDLLTTTIEALERALAAAAATRSKPWSERVASELANVRKAITAHTTSVEEEHGLFDEIRFKEPRLNTRVDELQMEHTALFARAEALAKRIPAGDDLDFGALRIEASQLLAALRAHRGAEADLIFEAFWTDLGAPD